MGRGHCCGWPWSRRRLCSVLDGRADPHSPVCSERARRHDDCLSNRRRRRTSAYRAENQPGPSCGMALGWTTRRSPDAIGANRRSRTTVLRLPLPVLRAAAASGVHPALSAHRLGVDRRQGRRTLRAARHLGVHPTPAAVDAGRRQTVIGDRGLLRHRLPSRADSTGIAYFARPAKASPPAPGNGSSWGVTPRPQLNETTWSARLTCGQAWPAIAAAG